MLMLISALCAVAVAATPAELGVFSGEVAAELMVEESELVAGMRDQLHVLGFSPDGKVALLVEQADEAVGGYLWRFEVRDLKSDALLDHLRYDEALFEQIPDRQALLDHRAPTFRAMAASHGVVFQTDLELHSLPWTWEGRTYDASFAALPVDEDDIERKATVTVTALGPSDTGLVSKKVGEVTWLAFDDCCGRPVGVLVKSPHEDRAALIVAAWDRGWEGPPNVLRHDVIGVHLTERFAPATP